mmetsp:Transcript_11576/g.16632  ORF Transcript_11576/g.16632 Transcript_11576/m.16632 type:complete len:620 (-) Transcript_11576:44-1903(-)
MTSGISMTSNKKKVEDKKKMSKKDLAITQSTASHDSTSKKRKANEDLTTASSEAKTKKRALKQLRQSTRKHHEDVARMKELWNKLRVKDNDKKDIERRMEELMRLLNGKAQEISMQHDASRVVQAAIQFGNSEQRESILKELIPSIPSLSKVQYAHFVVLKLIQYCCDDKKQQLLLLQSFRGHMPTLAVHSVGATVVEKLWTTFPSKMTASLRKELYGPHLAFVLSTSPQEQSTTTTAAAHANNKNDNTTKSLSLLALLQQYPEKRDVTLQYVWNSILNKGCEKNLCGLTFFQHLFWEYVCCLLQQNEEGKKRIQDIASTVADHSIHMLSTREGARVVAEFASYGTAKDRKRIMKSFKGYTKSSLLHRDAYLAILRVIDVTDDTVTTQKLLLNEILLAPEDKEKTNPSPLLELSLSDTGCKLFLRLLAPTEKAYFDPMELDVLAPAAIDGNPTSKKLNRNQELVQCLRSPLIDMATNHTIELMRSRSGSKVLREVYLSSPVEQQEIIAQAILNSQEEGKESPSIFEDPIGHRFLKNLILAETKDNNEVSFAAMFYSHYAGKLMSSVAFCNRGAFVVEALAQSNSKISEKVKKELKESKKEIKKLAKTQKGFEALDKKVS